MIHALVYQQLGSAITGMFQAKCPSVFEGPGIAKYYQSFESGSALFSGTMVKDTEPFCGAYVLKNPYRIFRQEEGELGIMLSSYGTVGYFHLTTPYIFVKL